MSDHDIRIDGGVRHDQRLPLAPPHREEVGCLKREIKTALKSASFGTALCLFSLFFLGPALVRASGAQVSARRPGFPKQPVGPFVGGATGANIGSYFVGRQCRHPDYRDYCPNGGAGGTDRCCR